MNKSIILSVTLIVVLSSLISFTAYAQSTSSNINEKTKILFDGQNATVIVSVNNTQYLHLRFMKLFVFKSNSPSGSPVAFSIIKDMNTKKTQSYDKTMGNYTKITMWKNITIQNRSHHEKSNPKSFKINLSFDFYIAQKIYKKKNITVTKNMIRYDTHITSNLRNYYIFLEEHINYGEQNSHASRVFECNETHDHWKMMNPTKHITEHHFGNKHIGMVGFGKENITFKYMWVYQSNINTFYSYDGSNFILYFGFEDRNGTVIQDPYISLPVNLTGNSISLIHGVKHIVNYIFDHALSLGLGILLAVVVILSVPLMKKRSL